MAYLNFLDLGELAC